MDSTDTTTPSPSITGKMSWSKRFENTLIIDISSLIVLMEHNNIYLMIVIQMLLNLHKKSWMEGLTLQDYSEHCKLNETIVKEMLELAKNYNKVHLLELVLQSESTFYSFYRKAKIIFFAGRNVSIFRLHLFSMSL